MALNATQPALHCISVIELPALLSEEKTVLLENVTHFQFRDKVKFSYVYNTDYLSS